MQASNEHWPCADGFAIPVTIYRPTQVRAVLVVAPAMGVPRRYYRGFASAMAAHGLVVVTFDYRGIGEAAAGLKDPRHTTFQDWGRLDLHAVYEQVFARFPATPVFHLGHSAGAQLPGLSPLSERLAGLVFVAGPRPHVSQDRGAYRLFSTFWWYVALPLGSLGRWFPARRLGFTSVDIPSGVAAEWGRWARSPRYLFSPEHGIDTARYARLALPLLAYSFSDDLYTPLASAEALLSEYPACTITRRHVRPSELGAKAIGHLGFFRDVAQPLWRETAEWLLARSAAAAPARASVG